MTETNKNKSNNIPVDFTLGVFTWQHILLVGGTVAFVSYLLYKYPPQK